MTAKKKPTAKPQFVTNKRFANFAQVLRKSMGSFEAVVNRVDGLARDLAAQFDLVTRLGLRLEATISDHGAFAPELADHETRIAKLERPPDVSPGHAPAMDTVVQQLKRKSQLDFNRIQELEFKLRDLESQIDRLVGPLRMGETLETRRQLFRETMLKHAAANSNAINQQSSEGIR